MSWADEKRAVTTAVLQEFGEEVRHFAGGIGAGVDVTVAWSDPSELSAAGVAGTLFADSVSSGFVTQPTKNDVFQRAGIDYRVFDLQGPDQTGAIYIHLKR